MITKEFSVSDGHFTHSFKGGNIDFVTTKDGLSQFKYSYLCGNEEDLYTDPDKPFYTDKDIMFQVTFHVNDDHAGKYKDLFPIKNNDTYYCKKYEYMSDEQTLMFRDSEETVDGINNYKYKLGYGWWLRDMFIWPDGHLGWDNPFGDMIKWVTPFYCKYESDQHNYSFYAMLCYNS